MLQGNGRHDNPELYGCLYVSVEPVSAVAEQLQRLAGTSLEAPDLVRRGLPLALATIDFDESGELLDLDDPTVLVGEGMCPSQDRDERPLRHPGRRRRDLLTPSAGRRAALVVDHRGALAERHAFRPRR